MGFAPLPWLPDGANLEGAADVVLIVAKNLRQLLVSLP